MAAEPPTGRVIVIAPTRAACETIEIALGLHLDTFLERHHGERVRELARSGAGFGIIAGTGTGKTLAIRPIAEEILRAPLRVGVVNREREATPELPDLNVLIVTTGIARRWFQDGDILARDTLVVDEIHQTSAELELCLALGKRAGCRFIWLSATVDPRFYRNYLNSADVLQVTAFDPKKSAQVRVVALPPTQFLGRHFLSQVEAEKRGVGVFLPTRAGVEQAATEVGERFPQLRVAFYHGGEPIRAIRPFLEDEGAPKPYLLAMTAAGQSALNVRGLDTIVIDDTRFSNVITGGRNVLTRLPLGNNEILQMAGRVHGRVEGGRVFILSERAIDFATLRPTAPDFQLAGDSERVALTCADLGVRADELELPVPLNGPAYRRALAELQKRGIITDKGRLSHYGRTVEALPVDRVWAELLVNADRDLVPYLAVMSSIESLHRMTREERDLDGIIVPGSDHLTSYNLYAEAFERAGYVGEVYGLPRHLFESQAVENWAEARGVLVKSLEDAALAMACVLRALNVPLPLQMPLADEAVRRRFTDILARWMPFDLVIDEETANGQSARVGKTSVCGSMGAIAGTLRYFADRHGVPRAGIEGTRLGFDQLRRNARPAQIEFVYDANRPATPLILKRTVEYHGFILESQSEPVREFSPEFAGQARRALAEALARGDAYHTAVRANHGSIEEVREMYRRSGGQTPRLGGAELADFYEAQLEALGINSLLEFRQARLPVRADDFVPATRRAQLWALPSEVRVRGVAVKIHYAVEESASEGSESKINGVARLHLPEKLARTLREEELPVLDRSLRFMVTRGQRGAVRADRLEELQELLEGPWSPNDTEPQEPTRGREKRDVKAANKQGGPKKGKRPRVPGRGGRRR
ncbi:MAG: DEAD/DEAH box helicase [Armatimonadetes bacterium]|nr:DEAD/DEAH box helicase [Armatimonadota bacterium]